MDGLNGLKEWRDHVPRILVGFAESTCRKRLAWRSTENDVSGSPIACQIDVPDIAAMMLRIWRVGPVRGDSILVPLDASDGMNACGLEAEREPPQDRRTDQLRETHT